MAVSQEGLGKRLRAARDACQMTQEEVARHLGMARSTVAQIELGNRAVTGLELDRLADLYGRDIRELLADDYREQDALVALFRAHPEISGERATASWDSGLRPCAEGRSLGRSSVSWRSRWPCRNGSSTPFWQRRDWIPVMTKSTFFCPEIDDNPLDGGLLPGLRGELG